jgi:hypothetical protein
MRRFTNDCHVLQCLCERVSPPPDPVAEAIVGSRSQMARSRGSNNIGFMKRVSIEWYRGHDVALRTEAARSTRS